MTVRTFIALAMVAVLGVPGIACRTVSAEVEAEAETPQATASTGRGWFPFRFHRVARHDLPVGTIVSVRLLDPVDSAASRNGDTVRAVVATDVSADGTRVIPAGTPVRARVSDVRPPKRFGGRALVTVEILGAELPDEYVALDGMASAVSRSQVGKDSAVIAGSAVGGALLTRLFGGSGGDVAAGAVVGGGIGTAVASRRGPSAYLPAGTIVQARTADPERLGVASNT